MDIKRKTALEIIKRCKCENAYANLLLSKRLSQFEDKRDRAFIETLVLSTLENLLLIDYYISKISSVKINKIENSVLCILEMGICQCMFLNVPDNAAVDESVKLAKSLKLNRSSGFINAVLRNFLRKKDEIKLPDDDLIHLSIKYSVDIDTVKLLFNQYGKEKLTEILKNLFIKRDKIFCAVNTLKISEDDLIKEFEKENIKALKTDFKNLISVKISSDISKTNCFLNGYFHIIGVASFLAAKALSVNENDKVIDVCACPGGKTFKIAYDMNSKSKIVAFDKYENKGKALINNAKRLGIDNIEFCQKDAEILDDKYFNFADKILCDVPCSALGVMGQKPEIKLKKINFEKIYEIQSKILHNASKYLKPGGLLIYSTCTLNKRENTEIVSNFLTNNNEFSIDYSINILDNISGSSQFLPDENFDGFYICALRRKNNG